jgi:hypothetical protein
VFPVAKKKFLDFLPVGFLLISCKSLQKKQRFENTSLTRENGHAVHAAGVADPFLLKEHSRYTEMTAIIFCFKKQVRRTPLCLGFGIWNLEFPDKPGPFWFRLVWLVSSVDKGNRFEEVRNRFGVLQDPFAA